MRLKRPPDYWELRVYAGRDPLTGKSRYVSKSFRGGKRAATNELSRLVAEIDDGEVSAEQSINGLLSAHIEHLEARGREARTIEGYRSIARMVAKDRIGNRQIADVGPKDFDDFYARLARRELSAGTIQRYHSLLGAATQQAMRWGWIDRNVVRLATAPRARRKARTIPTPAVIAAVLNEAAASRNSENLIAFRLLAATGARRGEVCGLRWSSVDLDRERIWIRHAIARLADGTLVEKEPKSHQTRELAIDRATTELLASHLEHQRRLAQAAGGDLLDDAYVLADLADDPSGATPSSPDRLTQAFQRITRRVPRAAGLRLHDLRHWHASTQLDAGEPLPAVAARIGDHVDTLAKVYAHRSHRNDHDAANRLGELLDTASDRGSDGPRG